MFGFSKKKIDTAVYAPVKGRCIDITQVEDVAFSSKVMGDGVAIVPADNVIKAPCDGKITMFFETGHAFGIQADNGAELLIHIGIDTVNLNGSGFEILKKVHARVKKGDPIVRFDLEKMSVQYDMTTMVIVTNGKAFRKLMLGQQTDTESPILEGIA